MIRSHRFRGKRFGVRFEARPGPAGAHCTHNTELVFRNRVDAARELEWFIHEALHACLWDLDETAIHETARDLARFLWRLSYRRLPHA